MKTGVPNKVCLKDLTAVSTPKGHSARGKQRSTKMPSTRATQLLFVTEKQSVTILKKIKKKILALKVHQLACPAQLIDFITPPGNA